MISIHEATISTAQIEIKTLTVRGRQVTLALFRQLQEEELFDEKTLVFAGQPWGLVNYHTGECSHYGGHVHAVWQLGQELRRSCIVTHAPSTELYGSMRRSLEVVEQLITPPRVVVVGYTPAKCPLDKLQDDIDHQRKEEEELARHPEWSPHDLKDREKRIAEKANQYNRTLGLPPANRDVPLMRRRAAALITRRQEAMEKYKLDYDKVIARLLKLPQLFIAV